MAMVRPIFQARLVCGCHQISGVLDLFRTKWAFLHGVSFRAKRQQTWISQREKALISQSLSNCPDNAGWLNGGGGGHTTVFLNIQNKSIYVFVNFLNTPKSTPKKFYYPRLSLGNLSWSDPQKTICATY
jgi:hypothetical protein